jgi:hypothetical protein
MMGREQNYASAPQQIFGKKSKIENYENVKFINNNNKKNS